MTWSRWHRSPRTPRRFTCHWEVERLEDRCTPSATMIRDINPSPFGSEPQDFAPVGDVILFSAAQPGSGFELWRTDGTEEGTVLVKDINTGIDPKLGFPLSSFPRNLISFNGLVYFTADDGKLGREMWVSDGTEEGTTLFLDFHPEGFGAGFIQFTLVHNTLFFTAGTPEYGFELWKTDGTLEGTVLVKDIRPGSDGGMPSFLTHVNGLLFFTANDGERGSELWASDGTEEGTYLVRDIGPGFFGSNPFWLTAGAGRLYFTAFTPETGDELWASDGTEEGTYLVKDVNPGPADSFARHFREVHGILFFAAREAQTGFELWASDGTEKGTYQVRDLNPGPVDGLDFTLTEFEEYGGLAYFSANDGAAGFELWVSDGTAKGTYRVKDLNPTGHSQIGWLTPFNGVLYFGATDGVSGRELWASDGTEEGTFLLKEINAGPGHSNPAFLTVIGDVLYFSADDGRTGRELWAILPSPLDEPPTPEGTRDVVAARPSVFSWARAGVTGQAPILTATEGRQGAERADTSARLEAPKRPAAGRRADTPVQTVDALFAWDGGWLLP